MHTALAVYALLGFITIRILLSVYRSVFSPLRNIPGPLAARFSRLWYLRRVHNGQFEKDNISLHKKHGPIVRVAPDHYSIDDLAAVKQVYGIGTQFRKSDWYYGWQHPDPARYTVFASRDIKLHSQQRRKFNAMYSTTNLLNFEPFVDRCADIFIQRLNEFVAAGQTFDMGHWMQCYAFDVIACITYGERFGFLDQGKDIDGAMAHLWKTMQYSTGIGIFHEWHAALWPVTSRIPGTGGEGRQYVMNFVQAQLDKRRAERKKCDAESGHAGRKRDVEEGLPEDFLEKMLNAQEADPGKIEMKDVFAMGLSNVIAGSDTTAISLSSILYHLIKTPQAMKRLRQEIQEKEAAGECNGAKITYKESLSMPYFQVVMKEALRMHPATGLPLWRVVPEPGATISGTFFPANTVVGINTWCAHYNTDVFGSDASYFRPERWLELSTEQLKKMDAYYMPFGLGSRTCLGRHISELEMGKLIPRLISAFDFELDVPELPWKTENYWFVKPTNFVVKVSKRLPQ